MSLYHIITLLYFFVAFLNIKVSGSFTCLLLSPLLEINCHGSRIVVLSRTGHIICAQNIFLNKRMRAMPELL